MVIDMTYDDHAYSQSRHLNKVAPSRWLWQTHSQPRQVFAGPMLANDRDTATMAAMLSCIASVTNPGVATGQSIEDQRHLNSPPG